MASSAQALSPASPETGSAGPFRVMVVDDSAVIRGIFCKTLEQDPDIKVVSSAANGKAALGALAHADVEVLVLDIEMPVMDGMTALPLLLEENSTLKIIMASTLTLKNASISMKALNAGAADYISKPTSTGELHGAEEFRRELVSKVKELGRARRGAGASSMRSIGVSGTPPLSKLTPDKPISLRKPSLLPASVLTIASSTGGPQALVHVLSDLGADFHLPILIAQHMPTAFTAILAEHLGRATGRVSQEGADGMKVECDHIYVAPGDHHMTVVKEGSGVVLRLNQDPPENYCRPSAEPLLRSAADIWGSRCLTLVLTGMGHDGCAGAGAVVEAGGSVVAQDEATSVVWGMPGAVATAGLCCAVPRLSDIGLMIKKIAAGGGA